MIYLLFTHNDFTHPPDAAAGATGEGEGEGGPARCEPRVLQSFFQRAGRGGPEDAAVWSAVPLTARLGAAHQRETSALFSRRRKSTFYLLLFEKI